MTEKIGINWLALSDPALVSLLADFVRHHRLAQNKSQSQLATEAGVSRSTLSEFENGHRPNMLTFIQLLRALKLLHVLDTFQIQPQLSPIQLAKMQQKSRQRASKPAASSPRPTSDW